MSVEYYTRRDRELAWPPAARNATKWELARVEGRLVGPEVLRAGERFLMQGDAAGEYVRPFKDDRSSGVHVIRRDGVLTEIGECASVLPLENNEVI